MINDCKKLIFIYVSNKLPEYIYYSLNFASKNSGLDVLLLTNITEFSKKIKIDFSILNIDSFYNDTQYQKFLNKTTLNIEFWDGFWVKAYERFFILNQWLEFTGNNQVFHAECDNLIFNISELGMRLDGLGSGLFVPRDGGERCISSLIYINDKNVLENFCNYVSSSHINNNEMFEMYNYSKMFPGVYYLPTDSIFEISSKWNYINPNDIGGITDAASLGQWLTGVDPRHIIGPLFNKFKNENIKYLIDDCKFITNNDLNKIQLIYNEQTVNVFNLHIHSKTHKKLLNKNFLYKVLIKINNKKRTMISLNIINTFKKILR